MQSRLTTSGIWVRDGRVLIARRSAGGEIGSLWEFPGGKNRTGETLQQTLNREFTEELGVSVDVGREIFVHHFTNRGILYELHVFLVGSDQQALVHPGINSQLRWVRPDELSGYDLVPSDRACLDAVISALAAT